jgi:excisionase family DNA binding protein
VVAVNAAPLTLLTRPEAAEALRQSARTIDYLIAAGELPAVRIGRRVMVRQQAIAKFIEAREGRVKMLRKGGRK